MLKLNTYCKFLGAHLLISLKKSNFVIVNFIAMATDIKSIPVLKGKAAIAFNQKIAKNTAKKSSVNFTKEASMSAKILAKAKI